MFTGLTDHCGLIRARDLVANGMRLTVKTDFTHLQLGESIAIDGICLTLIDCVSGEFVVELSSETMALTTAKQYSVGQRVNLERAMLASDRLGGHFVSGHVDATVRVVECMQEGDFVKMTFAGIRGQQRGLLCPKGCVSINGVSLTINAVRSDGFSAMLIPHTLVRTNLSELTSGDVVNIEFDMMAKLIQRQLNLMGQSPVGVET